MTHPNSTSTDKGAAMLRKPSSQETPFNFRPSRPTSGRRERKRRHPGGGGAIVLSYWRKPRSAGRRTGGRGRCWGLLSCSPSAVYGAVQRARVGWDLYKLSLGGGECDCEPYYCLFALVTNVSPVRAPLGRACPLVLTGGINDPQIFISSPEISLLRYRLAIQPPLSLSIWTSLIHQIISCTSSVCQAFWSVLWMKSTGWARFLPLGRSQSSGGN